MHIHVLRRRAFTVLELLIVLVVLGILATLMLLKFTGASEKAMMAAMQNDLRNFATARALHLAEESGSSITGAASLPNFSFSNGVFEVGYMEEGAAQWAMVAGHEGTDVTCAITTMEAGSAQWISCSDEQDMGFSANAHGTIVEVSAEAAIQNLAFGPSTISAAAAWAAEPEDIALISWAWGDGQVTSGPATAELINTSHAYRDEGDYTITLTLVKKSGESKSGTRSITARLGEAGENLVVNGDGSLGRLNFSEASFVAEAAEGVEGYFALESNRARTALHDQAPIPLDTLAGYRLSVSVRRPEGTPEHRTILGFKFRDADGLHVAPVHFMRIADSRLAAPLTPGDTVIYLDDTSGWFNNSAEASRRVLTIWNYQDSRGHDYGEYTYSRRSMDDAWQDGAVSSQNTIRLSRPLPSIMGNPDHPNGTWPVGQAVSNTRGGDVDKYCLSRSDSVATEWRRFSGEIRGVDHSGQNDRCTFPPGAAFIEPVYRMGYNLAGPLGTMHLANIEMIQVP